MKRFLPVLLLSLAALSGFEAEVFSQTAERKKPKIKNFGSSLKRTTPENLAASRKKKEKNGGEETIRIETNLVVFDFLILNEKGSAVTGLKKEDFIVTEDDQPQEVREFAAGNDESISRSIVLVIDYSGSQSPYLERSVEAAKLLVDKLRPNDLMAIVTDDVKIIEDYTSDKKKLKDKLDSLKVKSYWSNDFPIDQPRHSTKRTIGKSRQYSALYSVLNEMFDEEDVRPIVIFQTDGDQLMYLKGQCKAEILCPAEDNKMADFAFEDLLAVSDKSRATIYTVVPGVKLLGLSPKEKKLRKDEDALIKVKYWGIDPKTLTSPSKEEIERRKKYDEQVKKHYPNGLPDRQEFLAKLSQYSGGWIDFLEKPEQAEEIYSKILTQIDLRYIVSYYPTNETKDGKRRTVKISVKNHLEYTVWGRKTYLAPLPD